MVGHGKTGLARSCRVPLKIGLSAARHQRRTTGRDDGSALQFVDWLPDWWSTRQLTSDASGSIRNGSTTARRSASSGSRIGVRISTEDLYREGFCAHVAHSRNQQVTLGSPMESRKAGPDIVNSSSHRQVLSFDSVVGAIHGKPNLLIHSIAGQ